MGRASGWRFAMKLWLIAVAVLAIIAIACGGGESIPSPTGQPATAVSWPSVTKPTPTQESTQETADSISSLLQGRGLPIDKITVFTAETDPNALLGRPHQYTSKVNFHDSRLEPPRDPARLDVQDGGSIEVFANQDDAEPRFDYVSGLAKSPLFAEYDYVEGKALLRLSHQLTPDQASEYEKEFRALLKGS